MQSICGEDDTLREKLQCQILFAGSKEQVDCLHQMFVEKLRRKSQKSQESERSSRRESVGVKSQWMKAVDSKIDRVYEKLNLLLSNQEMMLTKLKVLTSKQESIEGSIATALPLIDRNTNEKINRGEARAQAIFTNKIADKQKKWYKRVIDYTFPDLEASIHEELKEYLMMLPQRSTSNTTAFFRRIFELICDKNIAMLHRLPNFEDLGKNGTSKQTSKNNRPEVPEEELKRITRK